MKRTAPPVCARGSGCFWPATILRKLKAALIAGAMLLLVMQLCGPAFATITDPEYTRPLLDPATQTKWAAVIPNALMPAFVYTPYTDVAATLAGFPAGVCGVTEDCYTVTVRQFQQNLGLKDEVTGVGLSTTCWGYGTATNPPSTGPFTAGVWHAPAPTFKNTSGRPSRIQWVNELPNVAPPGLDPTYDCGPNAPDCYPYNRIVTHVHGAHVDSDSDGDPRQWYTPGSLITGPDYVKNPYGPEQTFRYVNTQEAGTVWYHDHAMGTTHNNTQMGMAGFYLVTDDNEKCLQGLLAPGTGGCPVGQVKVLPADPYEVGFALQDRTFWPDGQFALPDQPVRNLLDPACIFDVTGAVIPTTCPTVPFSKAIDGHLIPYDPAITDPALRGPYTAPNGSLEYFGNMPMVNGVVYGKYDVEPRIYRMRLIGGTDSRTWIIKLATSPGGAAIPIWQIGSEQGLLNNPVDRTAGIDLMPGERVDLLVDFRGLNPGTRVIMQNVGPDGPYEGPFVVPQPPASTVIPEIMAFDVIALSGVPDVPAPTVATNLRPVLGPIVPLIPTPGTPVRKVSLIETTDYLGRTLPTIDGRGYMTMGVPITETVMLNDVEQWDIINTTVDAHPMHLHLVSFQVIDRQLFDPASFVPPITDTVNNMFVQPFYMPVPGTTVPPYPWETGWKDTIDCPPGYVTRVKAKFDMSGLYVWHCHILSHEEHDMMRDLVVSSSPTWTITAAAAPNGSIAGSAANGGMITAVAAGPASVVAGSTVTYTATPAAGFEVDAIVVDGAQIQSTAAAPVSSHKFVGVVADHYINAYFRPIPNTVNLGIAGNGTVTGGAPGANLVATGSSVTYTFNPAAGNEVAGIVVDGAYTPSTPTAPITSYTFTNVAASHYLNVYFQPIPNVVNVAIAGPGANDVKNVAGTVSLVGANQVATGGTLELAFVPAAGNRVSGMVVDDVYTASTAAAPLTGYIFSGVAGPHYINVYFEATPAPLTFNIAAASNDLAMGTITTTAPGPPYAQGTNVVFNINPAPGRSLASLVVDGTLLLGPRTSFTFNNLQADHYINAYFQ